MTTDERTAATGIVRFLASEGAPRVGMLADGTITVLNVDSLATMLGLPLAEIRAICEAQGETV